MGESLDRRNSRRQSLELKVTVHPSGGGHSLCGTSTDISRRGVFVTLPEVLPVGERVDLVIEPGDAGGVVLVAGQVIHHDRGEGVGIEFRRPSAVASERLERLLALRAGRAPTRTR